MTTSADFGGKDVVITGGTGGLGAAVVAALLERGATCHLPIIEDALPAYLPWRDDPRVRARAGVDLASEDSVAGFYDAIGAAPWASIHLVGGFSMAPIVDTSLQAFRAMFAVNVDTCFLCCREAVRRMGGGGRIVNVGARPAVSPGGGMIAYSSSKAAVTSLTQCLAAEVVERGILVNAVLPSVIDTPANRRAMPDADHDSWPKPVQIAETIAFLASPGNQLTSGALVPVYGQH